MTEGSGAGSEIRIRNTAGKKVEAVHCTLYSVQRTSKEVRQPAEAVRHEREITNAGR
jgi:hypothetical protein